MLFEVDKKILNANNKPDRELKKQKAKSQSRSMENPHLKTPYLVTKK